MNNYKTLGYMQSSLLLILRTRTVITIRSDFGEMFLDKHCPLTNCLDLDFLPHLLDCRVLQGAVQRSPSIRYSDVFSEDLEKQVEVTTLYSQLLAARDKLLPPDRDEPGNDDLPVHQLQNNAGALH